MTALGSHLVLEMYDCSPSLLNDVEHLQATLRSAAEMARSTLLGEVCHRFEPQGVTVLGLLAESHISIHTWPELRYAAADVFTCGEHTQPENACKLLVQALQAGSHELRTLPRGEARAIRPTRVPRAVNG